MFLKEIINIGVLDLLTLVVNLASLWLVLRVLHPHQGFPPSTPVSSPVQKRVVHVCFKCVGLCPAMAWNPVHWWLP